VSSQKTLYLIDGSSYIYRAFYALGRLTNSRGMPTQAIYGFAQMLLKVMREKEPDYLCVVFDPPGPTHRHEMYAAYKATRQKMPEDLVAQVPYIKELVVYHGVARLEKEGYEADDIIATLTRWAGQHDLEVVIVSGDKDLVQLIHDPGVKQWDPQKERVFTEETVADKFGIAPRQMVDYLALVGDSTDNIPGVKGVGEKTARQLLGTWKSLDEIFHHIEDISPASLQAKLRTGRDSALLSRKLVTLESDVPVATKLEELRPQLPHRHELLRLYRELDFKAFLEALHREWGVVEEPSPPLPPESPIEIRIIHDQEALTQLLKILESQREFSLCLDSTSSAPMRADLRGIALSYQNHSACYVPLAAPGEDSQTRLTSEQVFKALRSAFDRSDIGKFGHNLKSDWILLKRNGLDLEGMTFDSMVASYLLGPGQHAQDLGRVTGEHLGEAINPSPSFFGHGDSQQRSAPPEARQVFFTQQTRTETGGLAPLPPLAATAAAATVCGSAERLRHLAQVLRGRLQEANQQQLFSSIELPLIRILGEMEYRGILLDGRKLASLAADFETLMNRKAIIIFELAKEEFNVQSPKQLSYILFEKLGLPVVKKTKSGPSTDSSVLEELALVHPIVEPILSYRSLAKLKGTYADVLPRLINPDTHRIHTSFNQTVTATGRLSSSDPNLQNIPIRSEEGRKIRETFIPSPGHVLLSVDYSQIELRILAHFSKDEHLLEAFSSGGDVHRQTAAEMYNVPQHEVTPEMRRQAKTVNFGIIYGMGAFGLARRLGISRPMAGGIIERYFDRYRGVKQYIETVIEIARKQGYSETILGRRRPLPELNSRNHTIRQQGERLAINSPIQGSAADLIKKAMIAVDGALKSQGFSCAMILQVHDELVFEVPTGELEATTQLIVQKMEGVEELAVPLKVELGWGENWAKAHF
jgi:DNA polymerase I